MDNNPEQNYFDHASKYFTKDEWNNLQPYERVRNQNKYDLYVYMTNSGFNMEKPDFMTRIKEPSPELPEPDKIDRTMSKRKNTEIPKQLSKSKKVDENDKSAPRIRYPKRNLPRKNYKEEDIIPDDRYVYCDVCLNEFVDACNIHSPILLADNQVPLRPKNPDRARATVPTGWLVVSSSKIRNGGEGVWALKTLKMGVRFGPYEGTAENDGSDGQYSWQIKKDGRVLSCIDGRDTSKANWMRYVNCARYKNEQNLMAYQYCGQIYYRAVVDISRGTELLVFYGPQFARDLGIDTKKFNSAPETPLEDNIFQCATCKLAFSSPIYLDNHTPRCRNKKNTKPVRAIVENSHDENVSNNISNDASFACHLCDKMYTVKELYNRHLMVKHCIYDSNSTNQESGTANNAVAECVPTSTDNNTAIESKNQKAANRRHKCSTCHKAFPSQWKLERHSRVHTGDRPFKCTTCHKTFTTLQNLNTHTRTHTGEKPYACDVCRRTFNQLASLTHHKRTHNNVRPYRCAVCRKTFTDASNLTKHMRIHTGEKPYICQHCQRVFSDSSHLKYHIRTRHNNGN